MIDVAILSVAISGLVSVIATVQNSRCDSIDIWGCKCHRRLKEEPQLKEPTFVASPVITGRTSIN